MQGELKSALSAVANKLFGENIEPEITRPEEKFGDYSTNLALQIAQRSGKNPRDVAQTLIQELEGVTGIKKIEIAGPGFINFTLTDETLHKMAHTSLPLSRPLEGKEILVEFGDPNPFKEMHIGHLYSYIVGDSLCRLLETSGATVRRLSYHGDIGLHVALTIWAMLKDNIKPVSTDTPLIPHIGAYYQKGVKAFAELPEIKAEVESINKSLYSRDNPEINELYDWARKESFREFDAVLSDLKIETDRRYLESKAATTGMELVHQNVSTIFKESQRAIIYEGEKVDLHTRVFITSNNLPTYETKDLGLAKLKDEDYPQANRSLIITAHEQSDYFKVMLAALSEINKPLADKTVHLYHGFVSLSSGKMSSRKGKVYTAIQLMADVQVAAKKLHGENPEIEYGAIKYGFLKHRLGSNIIYDAKESVSLEGNSGPYLQYAHARACAVLAKAESEQPAGDEIISLDDNERSLARMISEYPEVAEKATTELMPHYIATYLYELAQAFNRFYENSRVIGDERQALRLQLTKAYADVLKDGLGVLNISAPEHI